MAKFVLHIWDDRGRKVPAVIKKASARDLEITTMDPKWQTDWTSDYITKSGFDLYALKTGDGELAALGAYEINENNVVVQYYLYGESITKQSYTHRNSEISRHRQGNDCVWNQAFSGCGF